MPTNEQPQVQEQDRERPRTRYQHDLIVIDDLEYQVTVQIFDQDDERFSVYVDVALPVGDAHREYLEYAVHNLPLERLDEAVDIAKRAAMRLHKIHNG